MNAYKMKSTVVLVLARALILVIDVIAQKDTKIEIQIRNQNVKILTNAIWNLAELEVVQTIQEVSTVLVLMVYFEKKVVSNVDYVLMGSSQKN